MTANVPVKFYLYSKCQVNSNMVSGDYELRSFRLRVVSPTVSSPTSRVDSPTSNMSARLRLKLRTMTKIDSLT